MADYKYEIINELGVISTSKSGWRKEFNRVSWSGNEPKYDLREWAPKHEKVGKGMTFTEEELRALYAIITEEIQLLDEDL